MEKPVRAPLSTVQDAYGRRAQEYASLLGTVESLAAADVALVSEWALGIEGPVLDVGCGPEDLRDALRPSGLLDRIGEDRLFPTLPTAVQAFRRDTAVAHDHHDPAPPPA